ncbi:MAG: deaminase [Candidatus Korobacteraceae bacterium]
MTHSEFFDLARQTAGNSNCSSRQVGAVIASHGVVLAEGFNGVSSGFSNCIVAGCERCAMGGATGIGYDNCICIHAEQRAVATAAANGTAVSGSFLYITLRPCLQCLLLVYAAGIRQVRYIEDWRYPDNREQSYRTLAARFDLFEHFHKAAVAAERF